MTPRPTGAGVNRTTTAGTRTLTVYVAALTAFGSACASAPPPKPVAVPAQKPKPLTLDELIARADRRMADANYAAAVEGYDGVLARKPDHVTARYNRALALQRLGRSEEAAGAYRTVLEQNPGDMDAVLNLGAVLKARGQIDQAIALYQRALKQDPHNVSLLNNLSALLRSKGRHGLAIRVIRRLLMRDQDNIDAYKNLALIYYDQKKYKLTETILQNALKKARKAGRQDADIYVNLGMVELARGENGKAMAAFKASLDIDPDHLAANYNIGSLALAHRDYQLAAKAYLVVARAYPEDPEIQASLGYAFQGLQEHARAAEHLEKAKRLKLQKGARFALADTALPSDSDEQITLQLIKTKQDAGDNRGALRYAEQYMLQNGIRCSDEDFDGFCGRYNGIKLTIQMEEEAANAPAPEEAEEPPADPVDVFTDGTGDAGAPPAGPAEAGDSSDPEAGSEDRP